MSQLTGKTDLLPDKEFRYLRTVHCVTFLKGGILPTLPVTR